MGTVFSRTAVAGFVRIISTLRFHVFFWFFPQSKK